MPDHERDVIAGTEGGTATKDPLSEPVDVPEGGDWKSVEEQESGRPPIPEKPQTCFIFFAGSRPVEVEGAWEAVYEAVRGGKSGGDNGMVVLHSPEGHKLAVDTRLVASVRDEVTDF